LVAGFVFFERGAKKTIIKREREREKIEKPSQRREISFLFPKTRRNNFSPFTGK